jgi:hypothetical protein
MRIPVEEAMIPREKLTQYLLVSRLEDDKSKFLAQAGFTLENPDVLVKANEGMRKMKPELYSRIVVNRDIPGEDLHRGDVATVIEYLEHPGGGEDGAILEVFNVLGESLGVATVPVSAIEPLRADYVPAVRVSER